MSDERALPSEAIAMLESLAVHPGALRWPVDEDGRFLPPDVPHLARAMLDLHQRALDLEIVTQGDRNAAGVLGALDAENRRLMGEMNRLNDELDLLRQDRRS